MNVNVNSFIFYYAIGNLYILPFTLWKYHNPIILPGYIVSLLIGVHGLLLLVYQPLAEYQFIHGAAAI